jgi:hypothetical protein
MRKEISAELKYLSEFSPLPREMQAERRRDREGAAIH